VSAGAQLRRKPHQPVVWPDAAKAMKQDVPGHGETVPRGGAARRNGSDGAPLDGVSGAGWTTGLGAGTLGVMALDVVNPEPSVGPPSPEPNSDAPAPGRRKLWRAATWMAFVGLVAGALGMLTSLKPYRIISGSMAPTADVGSRVFADHVGGDGWNPNAGDIVVFKAPGGARDDADLECALPREPHTACLSATAGRTTISFVKRVVGLPGDRLRVVHGHVIRNGTPVHEPYARSCAGEICDLAEFTVPTGSYYVLGDNRGDSSDSRYWGPITHDEIVGRVVATYWPLSQLGAL
jgi:signal peptidase I